MRSYDIVMIILRMAVLTALLNVHLVILVKTGEGWSRCHSCPAAFQLKCLAFGMPRHMGEMGFQMGFEMFQPVLIGSNMFQLFNMFHGY